jgi:hypothetical protein
METNTLRDPHHKETKWEKRNGRNEMGETKWEKRDGRSEMGEARWEKRDGGSDCALQGSEIASVHTLSEADLVTDLLQDSIDKKMPIGPTLLGGD